MNTITKATEVEVATLPATMTASLQAAVDRIGTLIQHTGEVRTAESENRKSIATVLTDIRRESSSAEEAAGIVAARCAAAAQAWRTDPATAKLGEGLDDKARQKVVAEAYAKAVYYGVEALKQGMHSHPDYKGKDGKPLSFAFNKPKHSAVVAGTATVQAHITTSDRKPKPGTAGKVEVTAPAAEFVKPENVGEWKNQGIAAFGHMACLGTMLASGSGMNQAVAIQLCNLIDDMVKQNRVATSLGELIVNIKITAEARAKADAAEKAKGGKKSGTK